MQLRQDEHRTALGFRTVAETDALADCGVRILDACSTLVSRGVQVGPDTILYPGVVIQRDQASALTIGSRNVLYPGCMLMAEHGGRLVIGDNCELGPGGVLVKANTPDAEILLGNGVRLLNGAELTGRSHLGNGAQIIGQVSAQSVRLAGGHGGYAWPEPDERGALLKGTGLARGISLARGEVLSCQASFSSVDVERQARYHPGQPPEWQHPAGDRARMGVMADLITKLLPILHVRDPHAERDFYVRLGLRATYEGPEYPDFLAVGNDFVEFGLTRRPEPDPPAAGLTWQLGVSDIEALMEACSDAGYAFEVTTEQPRPDWSYRTVTVRSPNGLEVLFEEQPPAD